MNGLKYFLIFLSGMIATVAIAGLVTAICCGVNGLEFSEQIVEWAQKAEPVIEEVEETTSACVSALI